MLFEWDDDKEKINIAKHGIDFSTAAHVFQDENRIEFFDEAHNYPALVQKTLDGLKELTDDDLLLVLNLVNRLTKDHSI